MMAKKYSSPEAFKIMLQEKADKRKIFFNVFKSTTAVLLGCAVVFSSTVIAYNKVNSAKNPMSIQGTVNSDNPQNTGNSSNSSNTQNNSETLGNSSKPTENKVPEVTEPETEAIKSLVQKSKTEQYEYFIKSFNGVKTDAKTAENYKKKGINYKGIAEAGSMSKLLSSLMNTFLKEEEPKDAVYSGEDIMEKFPPAKVTSNLKESDIEKITCEEQGEYYIIKIVVKGGKDPEAGTGVGAIASIITKDQIMNPIKHIPGLKNLKPTCNYEDSSCEAKIEKSTGHMVEYVFDLPLILSFEDQNLRVGLEFYEWWRMTY